MACNCKGVGHGHSQRLHSSCKPLTGGWPAAVPHS